MPRRPALAKCLAADLRAGPRRHATSELEGATCQNLIWRELSIIQALTVDAMEALWKIMLSALVVCLALFMEAFSCLIMPPPNMFPLLTLVPVVLVPVPFCLVRACGGRDSELSETPRRAHPCADSALGTDDFLRLVVPGESTGPSSSPP